MKTLKEIVEIRKKIINDPDIFSMNFEDIAKRILTDLTQQNIYQLNFDEIRESYIAAQIDFYGNEIPKTESKFFQYICQQVPLKILPRKVLIEIYKTISKDLKEIKENLNLYHKEFAIIQEKKEKAKDRQENVDDKDDYRNLLLRHYIQINQEAKDEINRFKQENSDEIKNKALELSQGSQFYPSIKSLPLYKYEYLADCYKLENYSELANKFTYLDIKEYKDLKEKENLRNTDPSSFLDFVQEYIKNYQIIAKIKHYIQDNHNLDKRKTVLLEALKYLGNFSDPDKSKKIIITVLLKALKYLGNFSDPDKSKKIIIFVYLIPSQIEGIFYDYCKELGIKDRKIPKSFPKKIEKINKIKEFIEWEYFSFHFPLMRNPSAHGQITDETDPIELKITASLLLLDLHNVCEIINSRDLPINRMVSIIKDIQQHPSKNNHNFIVDLLFIKLLITLEYKIPDFYHLSNYEEDIINQTIKESDYFWGKLTELVKKKSIIPWGINKIVDNIKRAKIRDKTCIEIFKILSKKQHEPNPSKHPNYKDALEFREKLSKILDNFSQETPLLKSPDDNELLKFEQILSEVQSKFSKKE